MNVRRCFSWGLRATVSLYSCSCFCASWRMKIILHCYANCYTTLTIGALYKYTVGAGLEIVQGGSPNSSYDS